eukprot:2847189-Pyramimonas_sp.AAC.1
MPPAGDAGWAPDDGQSASSGGGVRRHGAQLLGHLKQPRHRGSHGGADCGREGLLGGYLRLRPGKIPIASTLVQLVHMHKRPAKRDTIPIKY